MFAREVSATTLSYRLNTIGRLYLCPSAALRPPFSSILHIYRGRQSWRVAPLLSSRTENRFDFVLGHERPLDDNRARRATGNLIVGSIRENYRGNVNDAL